MGNKIPSPCIDVCKYKRGGYCIGCGMSKTQKKSFKKLGGRKKQLRFIEKLMAQQVELGGFPMWPRAYRKRCRKKDMACPLDHELAGAETSPKNKEAA
ncbi:MAG: DUF1289 domain-containing protein [Pseudomonadota bacterium]